MYRRPFRSATPENALGASQRPRRRPRLALRCATFPDEALPHPHLLQQRPGERHAPFPVVAGLGVPERQVIPDPEANHYSRFFTFNSFL